MSLLSYSIDYFKSLLTYSKIEGSHDSKNNIRQNLGYYMKQLKESNHNDEKVIEPLLHQIHDEIQLNNFDNFKNQYMTYLRILADREDYIESFNKNRICMITGCLTDIPNLSSSKWNMWGSYKQFLFGKCVVDALNKYYDYDLHPVWGCLLNPTGGIVGSGNKELISFKWNNPISIHGCVHDASGYLYNYHGIGMGYNYLGTWKTLFPTSSPFSCQYAGIQFWNYLC